MRLFILLLLSFSLHAQSISTFEIVQADSLFTIDSTLWSTYPSSLTFGGISGLSRMENGNLLLVSDRQAKGGLQESWAFILNSQNRVVHTFRFFGVENVEALRLDTANKNIWFTYEKHDSTGIGFIDSLSSIHYLETQALKSDNRGIEAIALGQDLWYAYESQTTAIDVVRWPFFDRNKAEVYKYPFDQRSCLSKEQPLNANLGNGISDILSFPNDVDKLLIMERCFNGKYAFIAIFEAKINGSVLSKRKVFNWDYSTTFQSKPLKPDNMEGMEWGLELDDKRSIYLISDDNHSRNQRTILLRLREQ